MTVYVVDIEEVPTRYTAQWKTWHKDLFEKEGIDYKWIGFDDVIEARKDEFLSFIPSNDYKARQTLVICEYLHHKDINDNDLILFLDAWHPGIIAVRQMLLTYEKDVKLAGFWHAGSYDPYDMLGKLRDKFLYFEKAIHDCLDYNLFATEFSKELFAITMAANRIPINSKRMHKVGFLYDTSHLYASDKENIIVFPHRIAMEKQVYMFDEFQEYAKARRSDIGDYEFIKTMEVTKSKAEYYELLSKAKYALSFAKQETFGISMMECVYSGCFPVVPDKLSYSELYPSQYKYNPMKKSRDSIYDEILDMIIWAEHHSITTSPARKILDQVLDGKDLVDLIKSI